MNIHRELTELNTAQRIPNAENRDLRIKVETTQRHIQSTENELDEYRIKIQTLEEHFKNVQDELLITQRLCNARQNEIDTEEHMKIMNQRDIDRLKTDILTIENQLIKIKDRKSFFTKQILHINQSMTEIQDQTAYDEKILKTWIEESMQKDEDLMALMKYTKEDDSQVKNLTLKIERLSKESIQKKRAIENEILDTTSFQIELDKTADHFRRSHRHRQELIQRWENIIQQMHQRDRDIDLLAIQLIKIKAEGRSIDEQLSEKREFYAKEQRNNTECQLNISMAERQAVKLRLHYDELEQTRLLYENELSGLRRIVERTENDKETAHALVNQLKDQLINRQQYLNEIILQKHKLITKKTQIQNAKYTAEEKANQMDQLYIDEREHETKLNTQLKFLSEKLYKLTQDLFTSKDKEQTSQSEIHGSLVTLEHLQIKITQLDNEISKQHEILYHQDFKIQMFQHRLDRIQGDKSLEEQVKLHQKIIELQSEMQRTHDEYTMINNLTKQNQEEMKYLKKYLEELNQEKQNQQYQLDEIDSQDKTSQKLMKKLSDDKNNLLVDEQFMRLEIKRSRSLLHSKADHIMNLETRRIQLQTITKERRNEITIFQAKLRLELREEEGRTSEISSQLHHRIAKIDKLKKRYEIIQIKMIPPDVIKSEETSQAYYVIKAAREKDELQRQGDELNAKNRKAERELIALQNTLQIFNNENHHIKKSFKKPFDKHAKKRRQILKLEDDCKDLERQLIQTDRNISANQQIERSNEEHDFELRLLKEFNKKIDLLINQTISMDQDARHCYNILKEQSDFEEISRTSSISLNVQSNSIRSSLSQLSKTSLRQTPPVASVQLRLDGLRLSNGNAHRQQKSSSSVKRTSE